ncbi:hypothetical protein DRE_05057 [Drechslerella stenobrocha 248]|uniref:Uncharacterized protein n=1 Tax=Drechslerella stenobrocha 248 TaxID=1043628 RepID=W7I9L0_9PEZI|nr:hypothetical protein DRE_05057 [Drechslerella stenobrocha 248]
MSTFVRASKSALARATGPARALQARQMHVSGACPSPPRSQPLSEAGNYTSIYSSRPPIHRMQKFTPMQLTCNFQTTPSKLDSPILLIMPRMSESLREEIATVPRINPASSSKLLISTPHGDTAHITSPSGIATSSS